MKKIVFILIASALATASFAQTMSAQEEREFYQKAYTVINDYAESATVHSASKKDQFRSLFESGDVQIFNDLMSLSNKPTLTVDDYIDLLGRARTVKVSVKNVRKKEHAFYDETKKVWKLPVSFEKSISFVNSCDVLFDSYEFFGRDYQFEVEFSLYEDGVCYISSLTADNTNMKFPDKYEVLEKKDERDNKLTLNGSIINFNTYDQVLLPPRAQIKYLGSNVERRELSDDCGGKVIHAQYNDQKFRVRPNVGFSLGGFNKLSGADGITTSGSSEMSFGVDLGFVFPSTGRLQTGIFAGLGISKNTLEMNWKPELASDGASNYSYSATSEADEDNESYIRHYSIGANGISQKLDATNITIPLYVDLEYRIGPALSGYADLGLKINMTSGSCTATIDGYDVWGEYSGYGNTPLIIRNDPQNPISLNDFGYKNAGSINVNEQIVESKMALDALLGVGLRYNVGKTFALDAGVQYVTGTNSWESKVKDQFLTYTITEKEMTNLLVKSSGIKHSALRFTASVILKF